MESMDVVSTFISIRDQECVVRSGKLFKPIFSNLRIMMTKIIISHPNILLKRSLEPDVPPYSVTPYGFTSVYQAPLPIPILVPPFV